MDQCATTPSSYVYQLDSKGVMIARADYVVTHELLAQANSLQVVDVFTVRWTSTFGQYSKLTFNITAICGTGCTASGSLTTKPSPGGTSSAAFTYSGTLAGGSVVTANPQWTGFASSSDGGPGPSIGNVGITTFRCDSQLAPIGPGCVFPQGAIPTITTLASLPNIAAGIRAIQAAGGYGVPGGGLPLQRSTNPAVQSYNRGIACPSSAQPPAGTPAANTSCDEYPFATTYQGAGYVSPPGSGITWVPPSEQNSQGGLLNGFYNSQRLLDGEQFYVAV